ncbi:MAG: hypothetical protein Q8L56_03185 [Rhodocyclaceae bacterium]|nr:hypothetical protein [Rhodocyclaceae bacterium]
MTQRSAVKKLVLVCAGGSLTCAVLTLGLSFWSWMTYGKHVYTGSLFAATFFFFSAAVVLYEMSRPQQPLPVEEADAKDAHP